MHAPEYWAWGGPDHNRLALRLGYIRPRLNSRAVCCSERSMLADQSLLSASNCDGDMHARSIQPMAGHSTWPARLARPL